MTQIRIPVKVKYADDFARIYATGAIGGFNGFDFRIAFFNDIVNHPEDPSQSPTVTREVKVEVVLSLIALKQLSKWLNQHLAELEKIGGEIKDQFPQQTGQKREPPSGYYV
ncbi:MAG: DUF3467 domain-containing protein [Thermoproteota archaeon]